MESTVRYTQRSETLLLIRKAWLVASIDIPFDKPRRLIPVGTEVALLGNHRFHKPWVGPPQLVNLAVEDSLNRPV